MKQINVPQSGSQANTTASHNRFGQYLRNRRTPVNVNSTRQQTVRAQLSLASSSWRNLSEAQREAWNTYAAGRTFTDSLGQQITLTGFQAYVGQYVVNQTIGLGSPTTPPSGTIPSIPTLTIGTTTVAGLAGSINDIDPDPMPAVIVFSSPPLSAGRSFNNDYRLIAVKTNIADAANVILAADVSAKWGTLAAGQKFFFKAVPVEANGLYGQPSFVSTTLT